MGNSRNTGYLQNTIKVSDTGAITFVSGSTTLMSISNTGAVSSSATTVSSSVDNLVVNNNAVLGSSESSTVSIPAFIASDLYPIADTYKLGSPANYWTIAYVQTGSFNEVNVTGRITAQTLVVQTITSSVDFVTGSTQFGSLLTNTHVFSGSVIINPGGLFVGSNRLVGIGTASPAYALEINSGSASPTELAIVNTNAAGAARLSLRNTERDFILTSNTADDLLSFAYGGSNRLQFNTTNQWFNSGNVGIGTSTPTSKLFVLGTGTYGTPTNEILTSDTTIFSSEMNNDAYNSILQLVSVRQSLTTGASSNGFLGFSTIDDSNGEGIRDAGRIAIVNESASSRNSPTALGFWTNSGGTKTTTATEKIRITSGGNVGIGTITPNNLLSVRGNLDLGTTGISYVGPSQYGGVVFPRGQILFANTNTQNQFYISSNAYTNASGVFAYRNSGQPATTIGLDNGGMAFYTAGNGTADATISWTTAIGISNNGTVTRPNQPAFLAYNSSGFTVTAGGWYNISNAITTEEYDIGSNYGTSTAGRFVAPVAGRYFFYAGGWSSISSNGERYALCARVNNGALFYIGGGNYCITDSPLSGYSVVHNLNAGDYVDLWLFSAVGGTWGGGSHGAWWGGYLL